MYTELIHYFLGSVEKTGSPPKRMNAVDSISSHFLVCKVLFLRNSCARGKGHSPLSCLSHPHTAVPVTLRITTGPKARPPYILLLTAAQFTQPSRQFVILEMQLSLKKTNKGFSNHKLNHSLFPPADTIFF